VTREHLRRTADVQEQLGTAIVHVAQARMGLEGAWASNQYQLGSLMAAADRMPAIGDQGQLSASTGPEITSAMRWIPDIPVAYLMAAALVLCGVFFAGLLLSAAAREAKALAESGRNAGRWVYRMAA
jgi:hypothetical protein